MTRSEFVEDLRRSFGNVSVTPLLTEPALELVVIEETQPVRGTQMRSRVAFKVPDPVVGRPQQYVDPELSLRSGGQPSNATIQEAGGRLFKTWSLATEWTPERHSAAELAHTALSVWDR